MNLGIVTWVLCPGSHLARFLFGGFERKSIFKCIQVVGSTVPRCSKNEFCCWFLAEVILSNLSSHSGSILVDLSNRQ